MIVLGIETSCDECSAALVEDGKKILSNIVRTQVDIHRPYYGVVPELASRTHTEWIVPVVRKCASEAGVEPTQIDGIAVTNRPGLVGSLLVGLSFAKSYAYGLGIPFVAVDHIQAHLYAPHLEYDIEYPHLGLVASGGHTILGVAETAFDIRVMGTTIDDACGEAFDKVAKHYSLGFPGGKAIDHLARRGDPEAFRFPFPSLHKGEHRYDFSYSGLKTAVINQSEQFRIGESSDENIAASFEKAAIDLLMRKLKKAVADTGIRKIVLGGGVVANSYLRASLAEWDEIDYYLPSFALCTDNGAMIAGLGYHLLAAGEYSEFNENAFSRVSMFRHEYP